MSNTQWFAQQAMSQAEQQLLRLEALETLSTLEQNRTLQALATVEGWEFWKLGGFRLADGSVLQRFEQGWRSLNANEASGLLQNESQKPLEVGLHYCFVGSDGREKHSTAEARFELSPSQRWRLVVEYEAFTDSPLYGLEANCFAELGRDFWNLLVDTPQPSRRWRLEQIAGNPDWLELLTSIKPDFDQASQSNWPFLS